MIYKFRVTFEDYDDTIREIEIKSTQTFKDLYTAIQKAINFKTDAPSSFYISNDYWTKGQEITLDLTEKQQQKGTVAMDKSRLCDFIEDPHQKIYYIFDFVKHWSFHIELVRISDNQAGVEYPICVKSNGEAPRQFPLIIPVGDTDDEEDLDELDPLDTLHETEYAIEGKEEMEVLGLDAEEGEETEEEEENISEEISDEFSDNEGEEEEQKGDW